MKQIFNGKLFWVILVVLLLTIFIYPPWLSKRQPRYGPTTRVTGVSYYWDWLFIERSTSRGFNDEIQIITLDFGMIVAESIIALLLTIVICLIPFRRIGMLFGFIASGIKQSETKHEGTGASTHEWVCPKCNYINEMEGYKQEDICSKCGHLVKLNIPGHAKESSEEEPKD